MSARAAPRVGREWDANDSTHPLSMGHSESDPTPERMLIVRHERLDECTVSRERFWLGDLNAAADDVVGALEVWVVDDGARLVVVGIADDAAPSLERRLVGAALRELVGRGVTNVELDGPPGDGVAQELASLGFERIDGTDTWGTGGAG